MDIYNLPPLDMQLEPLRLRLEDQPSSRMLLGIALFAACGLLVSMFASAPSPQLSSEAALQIASNGAPTSAYLSQKGR